MPSGRTARGGRPPAALAGRLLRPLGSPLYADAARAAPPGTPRPAGPRSRCSRRGPTRRWATCRRCGCWARPTGSCSRARRPQLERFYPSAGGDPRAGDPWPALRGPCSWSTASTCAELMRRPVQTNEVGRCAALAGRFPARRARDRPAAAAARARVQRRAEPALGPLPLRAGRGRLAATRPRSCASATRSPTGGDRPSTSPPRCASGAAATRARSTRSARRGADARVLRLAPT